MHATAAKIQPDKVVRWCQNGDILRPVFHRAACSTFQTVDVIIAADRKKFMTLTGELS